MSDAERKIIDEWQAARNLALNIAVSRAMNTDSPSHSSVIDLAKAGTALSNRMDTLFQMLDFLHERVSQLEAASVSTGQNQ